MLRGGAARAAAVARLRGPAGSGALFQARAAAESVTWGSRGGRKRGVSRLGAQRGRGEPGSEPAPLSS